MKTAKLSAALAIFCAPVLWTVCAPSAPALAQSDGVRRGSVKLSGLYRAFAFVPQFGAAVGEAYVFSEAGDVYNGWPGTQPPETFDFARAKGQDPAHTGKYVVAGDKITFRWGNNQSETANFSLRRDPKTGKLNLVIGTYHGFRLIAWSKPLNGAFEPSTYQGGFADLRKDVPPIADRIAFTPDGQFAVAGDDAQSSLKGRYQVTGAVLTLMLSNGEVRTHSLHVFEYHQAAPAAVLIDGRPFLVKAN